MNHEYKYIYIHASMHAYVHKHAHIHTAYVLMGRFNVDWQPKKKEIKLFFIYYTPKLASYKYVYASVHVPRFPKQRKR